MEDKERLLQKTMPQYIILKPSFIGGFRERKNGFQAEKHHIVVDYVCFGEQY
jgi:hypothetical protein